MIQFPKFRMKIHGKKKEKKWSNLDKSAQSRCFTAVTYTDTLFASEYFSCTTVSVWVNNVKF